MSNRFKRSEKLKVGRLMPPKYHKLPDETYDVKKSEAVQWLIKNPAILEYIWDKYKQSNDVVYNPSTRKWQGVDWEGEEL